jgi:hypothetical protein
VTSGVPTDDVAQRNHPDAIRSLVYSGTVKFIAGTNGFDSSMNAQWNLYLDTLHFLGVGPHTQRPPAFKHDEEVRSLIPELIPTARPWEIENPNFDKALKRIRELRTLSAPELARALSHPNRHARGWALSELGVLGEIGLACFHVALRIGDSRSRASAIRGLSFCLDRFRRPETPSPNLPRDLPGAQAELRQALDDPDDLVRVCAAIHADLERRNDKRALSLLHQSLKSEDAEARIKAVRHLSVVASLQGAEVAEGIVPLIHDPSADVRFEAVAGLAWSDSAFEEHIEAALDDPDPNVRALANRVKNLNSGRA